MAETHWLALSILVLCCGCMAAPRESGGMYTPERLANIRANVERFDWAAKVRDGAARTAEQWLKVPDEDLWHMVPGQDLPRCIDVTMTYGKAGKDRPGCLVCGDKVFKHGNYPYSPNVWGKPWKLTCPSCGSVFPTNDFGAYYKSGVDERGLFNPAKADRSLLFNTEHADPNDPLHSWGVDDGFGYVDGNGQGHRYIAYYAWKYWQVLYSGVSALAEAFVYTGDKRYAAKCAILLDRIADVYPDIDWAPYAKRGWYHSDGGSGRGKIEGRIWETGVLTRFAQDYDKIITGLADQPELYAFLKAMGEKYELPSDKGSRELLLANIDEGILRCGAKAVMDQQIHGNEGMHQRAIAACAIALDSEPETTQWLDWIFAEKGGHVPAIIVGGIDRDGAGAEAAPGYALSWGGNLGSLADTLADYGRYTKHDIYRDFPQFAKTFTAGSRITVLDYTTPPIGDAGSTGSIGKVQSDPNFIVRGYRYLKDPQIGLAAYRANNGSAAGLGRSIVDADPDWVQKDIERIAAEAGASAGGLGPHHMQGYGFLTLEDGRQKAGTGLYMYYGRNGGHGHLDRLNIGIYGFGFDLAPDLGYPEYATSWPQRNEWTNPTLSHNTVVVNQIPQAVNWVGHPRFFKVLPGFQCAEVESPEVYPGITDYRRTIALVNVSDWLGYAVDIFRVVGGNDHLRSFHGPGVELVTTGLQLTQQPGTLRGPDVPFGTSFPRGPQFGYSWLTHIERDDLPPAQWTVDWRVPEGYRGATAQDNVHLRLWDLAPVDDVVLGDGEPPQNKPGNPRWLRHCLAHRSGEDLASTFVSLLEPYRDTPLIESVERLPIPDMDAHDGPAAIRVTLANGDVDTILYSPDGAPFAVSDTLRITGRLAFIRTRGEQIINASLVSGTELVCGEIALTAPFAAYTGTVVRFEDAAGKGVSHVWVDADLPTDGTLVGEEIVIANDRVRNACYTIEGVTREGDQTAISLGNVSLVRGYLNNADYAAGVKYNFEPGASFEIPTHAVLGAEG